MDEKIKTWTLRFPAKENPNMEKALLDWPLVLQYDVKAKYRMISRKFSVMKFFHASVRFTNQKPRATRVCTLSINQSNRSISVRLLFLFRSRVFISRSYENRSISPRKTRLPLQMFRCSWKFSAGKTQRVMFHYFPTWFFGNFLSTVNNPCDLHQCYSDRSRYTKWLWFRLVLFGLTVLETVLFLSPFNTDFFLLQLLFRSHTMLKGTEYLEGISGGNTVWGSPSPLNLVIITVV